VGWGGDSPREVPRGCEEWGGVWGPARQLGGAVEPVVLLMGGVCAGDARQALKQGRPGIAKWGPGTVTGGGDLNSKKKKPNSI
jgi:hypothetical protein